MNSEIPNFEVLDFSDACDTGYNSDAKQPEHVFINLFVEENRNSPNVDVDNQAQSHARLKVDSGADMTLLNKYYCSLLGYSFDDD